MIRELFFLFYQNILFIYVFFLFCRVCVSRHESMTCVPDNVYVYVLVWPLGCGVRNVVFTFSTLHTYGREQHTLLQHKHRHTHDTPNKIIGARNRNYALAVCNHLTENMCIHSRIGLGRNAPDHHTIATLTICAVLHLAIFIYKIYEIDVMGDPNPNTTIGQMKQENNNKIENGIGKSGSECV